MGLTILDRFDSEVLAGDETGVVFVISLLEHEPAVIAQAQRPVFVRYADEVLKESASKTRTYLGVPLRPVDWRFGTIFCGFDPVARRWIVRESATILQGEEPSAAP